MVLWLWNERGAHRIEDPRVVPTFFLHAPPSELPEICRRIEILDGVREVRDVSKRIALEDDEPKPVLEIVPRHYRDIRNLAHIQDGFRLVVLRSEEHTSELQSLAYLVCRLLLEKKKK